MANCQSSIVSSIVKMVWPAATKWFKKWLDNHGQPPPRPRSPGPPSRPMPGDSRVASAPVQAVVAILSYSGGLTWGFCDSLKNTRHLYFQFKFRVFSIYIDQLHNHHENYGHYNGNYRPSPTRMSYYMAADPLLQRNHLEPNQSPSRK